MTVLQVLTHSYHEDSIFLVSRFICEPWIIAQEEDRRVWNTNKRLRKDVVNLQKVIVFSAHPIVEGPHKRRIFRKNVRRAGRQLTPGVFVHEALLEDSSRWSKWVLNADLRDLRHDAERRP